MLLGIDHMIIAIDEPDAAIEALAQTLGVDAGDAGGRHPGWGTFNRLLWLGDTYVELLGIDDPDLAKTSWLGAPALRRLESGEGLVSWALASDSLDMDADRMAASGAPLVTRMPGHRPRPDGRVARWRLALPPVVGIEHPFLIEHDTTAAEWTPEDRAARAKMPGRVVSLDLPVDRVPGLGAAPAAIRLGLQEVRIAGAQAAEPTIRIDGTRAPRGQSWLLGCRWEIG